MKNKLVYVSILVTCALVYIAFKIKKTIPAPVTNATESKKITIGNTIISFPISVEKTYDIFYVFGGMDYATPNWMYKQIPEELFLNKIFVIAPYTKSFSETKKTLEDFLKKNSFKANKISIAGFSAGALNVQDNYNKSYEFVGLIDPSNRVSHLNINFGKNVYMFYNPNNWGYYPRIKSDMVKIAQNIKNSGGYTELVSLSHPNIPKYFFEKLIK